MILLASTSPRRVQLLREVGLEFTAVAPDTDETRRAREAPRALVARLAREKAQSAAVRAGQAGGAIVIAADTIVVATGGVVLGKPTSTEDAHKMLARLAGRTHTVLTGYALLRVAPDGKAAAPLVRVVASKVTMRKLSRAEIARYVATGEPMDKAGSYAAQGKGMALIERISGSYANVVGLPIAHVLRDLDARFGVPLFGGA